MMQELALVQQSWSEHDYSPEIDCQQPVDSPGDIPALSPCEHRRASKDGRVICAKIVEGENEVSPNVCRTCPVKAVNCAHLRFSLCQTVPSPLIVRHNGRTEVWDDDSPELRFERAACAARVVPIHDPHACAGCSLRQPLQAPVEAPLRQRRVAAAGRVVAFPSREAVAAAG
jgi:hypothetical protein